MIYLFNGLMTSFSYANIHFESCKRIQPASQEKISFNGLILLLHSFAFPEFIHNQKTFGVEINHCKCLIQFHRMDFLDNFVEVKYFMSLVFFYTPLVFGVFRGYKTFLYLHWWWICDFIIDLQNIIQIFNLQISNLEIRVQIFKYSYIFTILPYTCINIFKEDEAMPPKYNTRIKLMCSLHTKALCTP